jgi:hypothetical protein
VLLLEMMNTNNDIDTDLISAIVVYLTIYFIIIMKNILAILIILAIVNADVVELHDSNFSQ